MANQGYRHLHDVRTPLPGSVALGDADPNQVIDVTVYLKATGGEALKKKTMALANQHPLDRKHVTHEELAKLHSADPEDVKQLRDFASWHELTVLKVDAAHRTVQLRGTLANMSAAFETKVGRFQHQGNEYRARTSALRVPAAWQDHIEAVLGFDTRPHATPHFRVAHRRATPHETEASFSPRELANLYGFPEGAGGVPLDGTGQVIGIIELMAPKGSGYRLKELKSYFQSLGLKAPRIISESVDGGMNHPGHDPNDRQCADGEVMLDIEVAAAVAPGATIVVYFAPNTGRGFVDVINQAVHDSVHKPTIISLSWGSAEDPTDPTNGLIDQILTNAASLGITFCVASGDSGSRDNPDDPGHASVDFPASHPFALACGGTRLEVANGQVLAESVWQDSSGGGVSRLWQMPDYQKGAGVPHANNPAGPVMRGVPDVAGDADPGTGYGILVDGQRLTFGGTSAVAPLWAGLMARINQSLGRAAGFINPVLYKTPEAFRDIVDGSTQDYSGRKGWDPCTGLGSPNGTKVLAALAKP